MDRERHPRGLYILFFTEMWERFSFYLLLGILPLYLGDSQKGGMGWGDEQVAVLVGSYIALVYFTPFIGGLVVTSSCAWVKFFSIFRTSLICPN